MRKDFPQGFGIASEVVITNETLRGFVIDILSVKADGVTLAPIADLNKIDIDVILEKQGFQPFALFTGYLDDYLTGLYAQSTFYEVVKTARALRYQIPINFEGVLKLGEKDNLRIKFKADLAAFTAIANANSAISIESMTAIGNQTLLPKVIVYPYGNSETNFDKMLGSNVSKIVLATDFTAGYEASVKAKLSTLSLIADNFEDNSTEGVVFKNNASMLMNNPSNLVKNLVLYQNARIPLNNVKLRTKLTTGADTATKVITTQWVQV